MQVTLICSRNTRYVKNMQTKHITIMQW